MLPIRNAIIDATWIHIACVNTRSNSLAVTKCGSVANDANGMRLLTQTISSMRAIMKNPRNVIRRTTLRP